MSKPKIAIGCIVQWYEVEMYMEYLQSIVNAIKYSNSIDNVFVDLCFYLSENIFYLFNLHLHIYLTPHLGLNLPRRLKNGVDSISVVERRTMKST